LLANPMLLILLFILQGAPSSLCVCELAILSLRSTKTNLGFLRAILLSRASLSPIKSQNESVRC
jgi:hypothetical protein